MFNIYLRCLADSLTSKMSVMGMDEVYSV